MNRPLPGARRSRQRYAQTRGWDQSRAVGVVVHNPNGWFSVDLRPFNVKSLVVRGLKSNITKETLDLLVRKIQRWAIVPLKKATVTKSNDRTAIP